MVVIINYFRLATTRIPPGKHLLVASKVTNNHFDSRLTMARSSRGSEHRSFYSIRN